MATQEGGWATIQESLLDSFETVHGYRPELVGGITPTTSEIKETLQVTLEDAEHRVLQAVDEVIVELRKETDG